MQRIVAATWMGCASGREILSGIFRYARAKKRWHLSLLQLPNGFSDELVRQIKTYGIDGIITCDMKNPVLQELVGQTSAPMVVIGPKEPIPRPKGCKVSFVGCGDFSIGTLGAKHFLSLGNFNGFGFLHSVKGRVTPDEREIGFRETLAETGKSCSTFNSTVWPDTEIDKGKLMDWLMSLPKPAAVMCYYDPLAVQVLNVCRSSGLSVPGQISVLGVDNDELICESAQPQLSSILPDHERVGYLAARELNALLSKADRKAREITCPVLRIVERDSTRPIAPSAHLVRRALDFIDKNAAKGISVKDVVAHLGVSRRLADLRFNELEPCSIRQTIESRRLDLAEKRLFETSWPVCRIADASGYASMQAFESAFKRRHGMPPRKWRVLTRH